MVTAFNALYSASAVRRIFNLAAGVAVRLEKWAWVVWIHVVGQRPRFVSMVDFKRHFVDERRARARALSVAAVRGLPGLFTVSNPAKGTVYTVAPGETRIFCTCEDYQNQVRFWGRGCCKHGYAVLGQLGYATLGDYVNNN